MPKLENTLVTSFQFGALDNVAAADSAWDANTPMLFQALVSNEQIKSYGDNDLLAALTSPQVTLDAYEPAVDILINIGYTDV